MVQNNITDMEEGTKIIGRYILAFVESTGDVSPVFERKTRDIFAENGLEVDEIDEESYHDALRYADAMREIRDEVGEKTLRQAGAEQGGAVPWPPHVDSVADGLEFLVEADKQAHEAPSGSFEGDYTYEQTGETEGRVSIPDRAPYPVDNFKGVFEGVIKSLSSSSNVTISDVDAKPNEKAAFKISW